MKSKVARFLLLPSAAILCACLSWSELAPPLFYCPGAVVQVTYTDYSGTIPDPFTERYTITLEEVRFERLGHEADMVNRGVWIVAAAPAEVRDLLAGLSGVDCRQIKPILPESWPDAPIGGGATEYQVKYESGGLFEMRLGEGVTYENARLVTDPVRDFLRALQLPLEARAPYLDY
jgi:hypothetical protein